uniref:Uncharacterized protein n=1 Tax=Siphoviridae sp. cthHz3 TaxID=2825614 RepID=A0A8S5UYM5_9CAUD|nr:MAG TPA: hypothetical protein [Siphoviridae sp. cthHz3]
MSFLLQVNRCCSHKYFVFSFFWLLDWSLRAFLLHFV